MPHLVILIATLALATVQPAAACDAVDVRVVGFSADGTKMLRRIEADCGTKKAGDIPSYQADDPALALDVIDLQTGKEERSWTILKLRELGDRELRSRNWRAAEQEITALGIRIDPDLKGLGHRQPQWTLPDGRVLVVRDGCTSSPAGIGPAGTQAFIPFPDFECEGKRPAIRDVILSPDGRWLIPVGRVQGYESVAFTSTSSVFGACEGAP